MLVAALATACSGADAPTPSLPTAAVATVAATRTATLPPPLVASATLAAPTPTPPATTTLAPPTPTPCVAVICVVPAPHAVFMRPIGGGGNIYPDRTYPYGSTQGGPREPHHGVEFFNPAGTPVLAAAAGRVVFAGSDAEVTSISPQPGFYGNVVVVAHEVLGVGAPVFTLYAHLRRVDVVMDQAVAAGDQLGEVGQTGIAIGPHLHFEVRVGDNNYESTRNPELWLTPLRSRGQDWGALVGVVVGPDGERLRDVSVVVRPEAVSDGVVDKYLTTYSGLDNNGDDLLDENFGLGDLPPGTYRVGVNGVQTLIQTVTVAPGSVTVVRFTIEPLPPTETPDPRATPTSTETATLDPALPTPTETETPAAP